MKSEWVKCKIGDVARVCNEIADIQSGKEYHVFSLPAFDNDRQPERLFSNQINSGKFKVHGDLVLFNKLNVKFRRVWKVDNYQADDGICSMEFIPLAAKSNVCKNFLYYKLISRACTDTMYKAQNGTSNSQQRIRPEVLLNFEITLPPLPTQKKIAAILSALDAKIENNNAINKNLEAQAQSVYENIIMEKEKNGTLGDYCIVKSGFAFKSSWWTEEGIKVIKISNIGSGNIDWSNCSFVAKDKFELAKDFSAKCGDVVIAMTGATLGKFAIVSEQGEDILVNQRVGKFFLGEDPIKRLPYLFCLLNDKSVFDEIVNRGQGSAQANISGYDIMSVPCVVCNDAEISDFNNRCMPIFQKILVNRQENTRLAALRDTLLPKLMSGEIEV